ncbi:MAG: hypothetical protein CMJ07_00500 [Pelagibacterales bacterium]|jgi:hypothetical protein|nr:hypothetical protein [Pelagibacterales bacterium]|tara:strand:- start:471 stop:686 length:216 start_codon:yes stop_codon:yes gene_type:complete
MTEVELVQKYSNKLAELNELRDSGMLSFDEYNDLVEDFRDVKAIEADIDDPKLKVFASAVVNSVSSQIKTL